MWLVGSLVAVRLLKSSIFVSRIIFSSNESSSPDDADECPPSMSSNDKSSTWPLDRSERSSIRSMYVDEARCCRRLLGDRVASRSFCRTCAARLSVYISGISLVGGTRSHRKRSVSSNGSPRMKSKPHRWLAASWCLASSSSANLETREEENGICRSGHSSFELWRGEANVRASATCSSDLKESGERRHRRAEQIALYTRIILIKMHLRWIYFRLDFPAAQSTKFDCCELGACARQMSPLCSKRFPLFIYRCRAPLYFESSISARGHLHSCAARAPRSCVCRVSPLAKWLAAISQHTPYSMLTDSFPTKAKTHRVNLSLIYVTCTVNWPAACCRAITLAITCKSAARRRPRHGDDTITWTGPHKDNSGPDSSVRSADSLLYSPIAFLAIDGPEQVASDAVQRRSHSLRVVHLGAGQLDSVEHC